MFFPLHYVAIRGNAWVLSHGDFWTKHWASLAVVVLFLNEISPPLSSLLTAPRSTSGRGRDMSGLPLQHALMPWREGQRGNVQCGDGGLLKGGRCMEISWHFKGQYLKGSGIFLKPGQEISVTSYWFGVCVSHLIQWLIWREAACMLGFHLVSLKAYGFWFILSSFVQGCFIAKGWMTGFLAGCRDR